MDEYVDILEPPLFEPNGTVKAREQAFADGDWIGTFNLWIITSKPKPAVVYQMRSHKKSWAPGLLDIAAAGHYQAGEQLADGLREADEELGKQYKPGDITHLGRKVYVGKDTSGRTRNNLVDIYMIEDDSPLNSYRLQASEVEGICLCPITDLLRIHTDPDHSFTTDLLSHKGMWSKLKVTHASFPKNWDNYHYKIALLADRYFKGETQLVY